MAAVTQLGTVTWTTTAGDKTVTATPAVGDLIVVVAGHTGATAFDVSDNQGGSYARIAGDVISQSGDGLNVFVRKSLVAAATSTIYTSTQTGSTGGGLAVFKVTGMTRYGADAVRQTAVKTVQASGGTPAVTFPVPILTGNPLIGGVINSLSTGGVVTPPTSYTEDVDVGYATPTHGLETVRRDSGDTNTTVTWGSTLAGTYGIILVELDTNPWTGYYFPLNSLRRPPRLSRVVPVILEQAWYPDNAPALAGVNVDTPGAILWTGQDVALLFGDVSTAGAITWTGQTVTTTVGSPTTAGAITWTGQTVALLFGSVVSAGAVTWAGQTVVTTVGLTPSSGAVTWTGQTVALLFGDVAAAGAITWTGQTVTQREQDILPYLPPHSVPGRRLSAPNAGPRVLVSQRWYDYTGTTAFNVDVAGAIAWTGQSVVLAETVPVTAGSVTWSGQAVATTVGISVSPGAVSWSGQQVLLSQVVRVAPGAIGWAGQLLTTTVGVAVETAGAIAWAGQAVSFAPGHVDFAGLITFSGQGVVLTTAPYQWPVHTAGDWPVHTDDEWPVSTDQEWQVFE